MLNLQIAFFNNKECLLKGGPQNRGIFLTISLTQLELGYFGNPLHLKAENT